MIKFGHMADIHLGNRQYGLDIRRDDFEKAFIWACDKFIEEEVKLVLIAGDLFHHKNPDFSDVEVARNQLKRFKAKGIYVVGIVGNHDDASKSDKSSWVEDFYKENLLQSDGSFDVSCTRWIDVTPIMWSGNETTKIIKECYERELDYNDRDYYSILMVHGGPDNPELHISGQFKLKQLTDLNNKYDYIALGHIHKPYTVENFIVNPGSLETNSSNEWSYEGRGISIVTVDKVNDEFVHNIKLIPVPNNRPTYQRDIRFIFDYPELLEQIHDIPEQALIQINLVGNVDTPIKPIQIETLKQALVCTYNPLYLSISNRTKLKVTQKPTESVNLNDVFYELLDNDILAQLCTNIKNNYRDEKKMEALLNDHIESRIS